MNAAGAVVDDVPARGVAWAAVAIDVAPRRAVAAVVSGSAIVLTEGAAGAAILPWLLPWVVVIEVLGMEVGTIITPLGSCVCVWVCVCMRMCMMMAAGGGGLR